MTKSELVAALDAAHQSFFDYIDTLSEADFERANALKWSPGQQLEHIVLSVSPLYLAFRMPNFLLRYRFGTANRPSRAYETVVEKYETRLAQGGLAASPFVPKSVEMSRKKSVQKAYQKAVNGLTRQLAKYAESDLDTLILPHPLLGRMTVREMCYFTIHHVEHHHKMTKFNLANG